MHIHNKSNQKTIIAGATIFILYCDKNDYTILYFKGYDIWIQTVAAETLPGHRLSWVGFIW